MVYLQTYLDFKKKVTDMVVHQIILSRKDSHIFPELRI